MKHNATELLRYFENKENNHPAAYIKRSTAASFAMNLDLTHLSSHIPCGWRGFYLDFRRNSY
jgi:hypothetical protein